MKCFKVFKLLKLGFINTFTSCQLNLLRCPKLIRFFDFFSYVVIYTAFSTDTQHLLLSLSSFQPQKETEGSGSSFLSYKPLPAVSRITLRFKIGLQVNYCKDCRMLPKSSSPLIPFLNIFSRYGYGPQLLSREVSVSQD